MPVAFFHLSSTRPALLFAIIGHPLLLQLSLLLLLLPAQEGS